ncbi:MAG TPA: hypothetical protein DCL35_05965 [Candidatus Omnitrophica bacterium]|nr:hypothetical protein [Candidatus Omnitrophota bacterium]
MVSRRLGLDAAEKYIRSSRAILNLSARMFSRSQYLDAAAKLIFGFSGCRCVGIRLADAAGHIPYESYQGFSGKFLETENNLCLGKDQCACVRVIKREAKPSDASAMTPFGSFCVNQSRDFDKTLSKDERCLYRGVCIENGFLSIAVIPLRYRSSIIGAIHLADERENRIPGDVIGLMEFLSPVIAEGVQKFELSDNIRKSYDIQRKINAIMRLSLEEIGLEELLRQALETIVFIPWMAFELKAAIFLVDDDDPQTLVLRAHIGLPKKFEKEWARIPFEQSLSGQAVVNREVYFIDYADRGQETKYPGMPLYGHYNLPILFVNKILGIIRIYVREGYQRNRQDEEFLFSFAAALAAIINRRRTEKKLFKAYEELIESQNKLSGAQRLSDIGTLAATVAHELRNPLGVIRTAAYNIRKKSKDPQLYGHLDNIDKKVMESDRIISNLLCYSRIKLPHHEKVRIYDILEECTAAAKNKFKDFKVSVLKKYNGLKGCVLEADPLQIKEVFGNILDNAYDALAGNKRRVIEIEGACDQAAGEVKISFKDNGAGIDAQDLKRLSEPFFTTKARGTGLGLTVSFQIVHLHGGRIDVESRKGEGASFSVAIPLFKKQ